MNLNSFLRRSASTLVLCLVAPVFGQPTDGEIIAKARASYPLKTCVVSDEGISNLSDAIPHIHRVAGKPERVIFFCCEGCIDDFKADPAKFLKKLDDAAAKGKTAKDKKSGKAKAPEQGK